MNKLLVLTVLMALLLVGSASGAVLYADDFERVDSDSVGNGWTESEDTGSTKARITSGTLNLTDTDAANGVGVYINLTNFTAGNEGTGSVIEFDYFFDSTSYSSCGLSEVNARFNLHSWSKEYVANPMTSAGNIQDFTDGSANVIIASPTDGYGYHVRWSNISSVSFNARVEVNDTYKTITTGSGLTYNSPTFHCFTNNGGAAIEIRIDNFCHYDGATTYNDCFAAAPVPGGAQFAVGNQVRNASVRETSSQDYYFNLTYNTSAIDDVNATFFYNNVSKLANEQLSIINHTDFNTTVFNVTFETNLTETNNSDNTVHWQYAFGYNNGTRIFANITYVNQKIVYAYFWDNVTARNADITEGRTSFFNASLTKLENNLFGQQANFTWNVSNYLASIASNTSTQEWWSSSHIIGALDNDTSITNITVDINATATLTFNTTTLLRTTPANKGQQKAHKVILTSCGDTGTQTNSLHFDIYNEQDTGSYVVTNSEDLHRLQVNSTFWRTYGFSRTSQNNWTLCLNPSYGEEVVTNSTVQIGDGSTWAVRTPYDTQITLNDTLQNVSLYTINLTGTNVNLVTITVENANGISQSNLIVEVYRFFLANNTQTKISEQRTNEDGQLTEYLVLNDVFYSFIVKDTSGSTTLKTTSLQKIFDTSFLIRLGSGGIPGFSGWLALAQAFGNVVFEATGSTFQFTYDVGAVDTSSVTISNVCLKTEYETNATAGEFTQYHLLCSTGDAGTITSTALNRSLADDWAGTGFINLTDADGVTREYVLDHDGMSFSQGTGLEGVFLGTFLVIGLVSMSLWNPTVAVTVATGVLALLGATGVMGGMPWAITTTLVVMGLIVIWSLKT